MSPSPVDSSVTTANILYQAAGVDRLNPVSAGARSVGPLFSARQGAGLGGRLYHRDRTQTSCASLPGDAYAQPPYASFGMKTLNRSLNDTLGAERLVATLSGAFAMLATLIAALGLYGVVSYSVERRTTEIGLRMALGAAPASVLMLVMREAVTLVGIGLLIGLPSALELGHYVAAQLFGTEPTDWRIAAAASATLGVVALLAGFIPAQRARRLDPLAALRQE